MTRAHLVLLLFVCIALPTAAQTDQVPANPITPLRVGSDQTRAIKINEAIYQAIGRGQHVYGYDPRRQCHHRHFDAVQSLGWVRVNRPAARNALTTAMWSELATEIKLRADDPEIRVIILSGAGDKSFISGVDIADLQAQLQQPALAEESYRFTSRQTSPGFPWEIEQASFEF